MDNLWSNVVGGAAKGLCGYHSYDYDYDYHYDYHYHYRNVPQKVCADKHHLDDNLDNNLDNNCDYDEFKDADQGLMMLL